MRRFVLAVAVVAAFAAPAVAHAAPKVARPNPATYPLRLDYDNPLREPNGSTATLQPLAHAVIVAATNDRAHLQYELTDDLGGFTAAPVGATALVGGGRNVVAPVVHRSEIPLFEVAAGGEVVSYTFSGPPGPPPGPPDNGRQPIPGIGIPPLSPPPTPADTVPPANQGFGGAGKGNGGSGGTTTTGGGTTTRPRPTTTTKTTTTTTTTTGTAPGTTTSTTTSGGGGGGGGGSGSAGDCGAPGLSIVSDHASCVLGIVSGAPGDEVHEVMTVTNTSGVPYDLYLQGLGPDNNHLWHDLQMAVWDTSGPPPAVFPSLDSWLVGFNHLDYLNPGDVRNYEIELFLPASAGNADMGLSVAVDFHWQAVG